MAAYKVINLDSPIESDYWVDIPVRDPDTNKDAVDEEGRILVQRHVTRTVKQNEYQGIVNKIPTYDNLVTSYNTYVTENNRQVNLISEMATTATNNVTKLTETVNNHDSQIHALYTKINAIQGIDIDDFKLVTETNIKNIKNSYLPLVGGTLTGAVTINNNLTVTGTVTSTFNGNLTGDVIGNLTGNITGSASSATNDSVGRNIVGTYALKSHYPDRIGINWDTTFKGYVNLTVDQTTWGLITTANIGSQNVNYANSCNVANIANTAKKATSADYATNCTNAVNATNADMAKKATSADHATDSTNAYNLRTISHPDFFVRSEWNGSYFWTWVRAPDGTYMPILVERAKSANYADHATTADSATRLIGYDHNNGIYLGWDGTSLTMNVDNAASTKGEIITHLNIGSQSVKHATTADSANRAYPRMVGGGDINFHWEGRDGQPTWLWGGEDGSNMYVYNPAAFSVNHAKGADEAANAYNLRTTSHNDHFVRSEWDGTYFWTWVRAPDGGYRPVRVERANSAGYADNAGTASRSTNNGSFFINGYEVSVG